jgi:ribosome-associated protein
MADTARTEVMEIARLIEDHRGEDVTALYIGEMSSFTDFFIIATVRSGAHLKGLLRSLYEYFAQHGVEPLNRRKTPNPELGWILVDCGPFVIHLMDREHRSFYELEKLWFKNEVIYSSKSS